MTQYYFLIAGFLYGMYGPFQIKEMAVLDHRLSGIECGKPEMSWVGIYPKRLNLTGICVGKCPLSSSESLGVAPTMPTFSSSILTIFPDTSNRSTCLPKHRRRQVQNVPGIELSSLMNLEGGLLITELMYQPATGCPEYLEIANLDHSRKSWDSLRIQKNGGESILLPAMGEWPSGECRIFTEDRTRLLECYREVEPELVYEMDLFALNNDGATLNLMVADPVIGSIDQVQYGPSDHNYFLRNTSNVSLERNIMASRGNKWRSGFVQFGYRSPGFLPKWNMNLEFDVEFSTNTVYTRSGRKPSILEIGIGSGKVDGSMTIEIFDLNGSKVHTLANAIPLQGGEEFTWKGRGSDGQLLPEGLYLFWIYYFDVSGQKKIVKRTCALSNK